MKTDSDILLNQIGEFSLHEWLSSTLARNPLDPIGIGDDCVVLDIDSNRYLLLTTDRVPLSAYKRSSSYVGKLCVTHNFSDIICKGGLPIGLLLGTYVPRETSVEDWKTIIIAARDWAAKFNAYILGGDTKESPTLCIVGCAVGFVEKSKLLRRDTANSGDILAVTLANARKIGLPWTYILSNSLHWNLPGARLRFPGGALHGPKSFPPISRDNSC